jgi:hypothetical protein
MITFLDSIEAQTVLVDLTKQLNRLPYNSDLHRLHINLYGLISELSKLEVYARRTGPRSRWTIARNKKKAEIQTAMSYLAQLLLIAQLMA